MSKTLKIGLICESTEISAESFEDSLYTICVGFHNNSTSLEVEDFYSSIIIDFNNLPSDIFWDEIIGKPEFAEVATSGDYNDLENTPEVLDLEALTILEIAELLNF